MASDVTERNATSDPAPAPAFPDDPRAFGGGGSAGTGVHRSEGTIYDCEVEGVIPADLDGAFFRVGPDPQYPKAPQYSGDIPFDGEGHASMFRIKGGRVDYRSRWVRNQRWKAQHQARRSLFGMYRNPFTDDPSVKGLSRGTSNTQVFLHHGKLLAFKEDSPPVVLDPETLETLDDYYTFGGALEGETYTAHPKIDSRTGDLVGYGYESRGLATDDIEILSVDRHGKANWHTWAKSPYSCMLHDFAVTERHVAFLAVPLLADMDQIMAGGLHYSWDSQQPSYFGVMERGGDGKDMRWYPGPTLMCTHVMGAWSEGSRIFVDMDGAEGNQFPFFPNKHKDFDPHKAMGQIRRFSVDLADSTANSFDMEVLFPGVTGVLARQDDRFHTLPYRYGYLLEIGPGGKAGWAMVDHKSGEVHRWQPGPDSSCSEMCFVPRSKDAPEGDGYLIGVVNRANQHSRSDVVLLDTRDIEAGPIATIKMPYRIVAQVHGFWAFAEDFGG
jgi:carotenoid cleavage dioxygenase-like enzyme